MIQQIKIGIFVTHPVPYHVPIWRLLAQEPGLEVKVHYFSQQGIENRPEPGFGLSMKWDQDLLANYESHFLDDVLIQDFEKAAISNPKSILAPLDVVLIHGYTHAYSRQILRLKKQFGYKIILRGEFSERTVRKRSWLKDQLREAYLRWFYSHIDAFAYIGAEARDHLIFRGIPAERMFFSPYSVDADFFTSQRQMISKPEAREQLGISQERTTFLYSGKMIDRKQPHFMAELANQLGQDPRFQLIMLGDGPLFESTKAKLAPLIAEGRAILPGFVNQSELAKYFCAADAFVFPSKSDTWGLVANEAMHFGLPCFVSDQVGCGSNLIVPHKTGEILLFNDLAAWQDCLARYLKEPERLKRMGENAIQRIQHYTPVHSAAGICQAIEFVQSVSCQIA